MTACVSEEHAGRVRYVAANPPGVPFVDIRFAVGLILIAVGALAALMGGIAVLNPNGNMPIGFRLGCGGMGAVGVLLVVFGLRLRNRAVAESPTLKDELEGTVAPSLPVVAKPSFLRHKPSLLPPPELGPAPQPRLVRPGVMLFYWLILVSFVVLVGGLVVGTLDLFDGRQQVGIVLTVGMVLLILLFPLYWVRRSRRGGRQSPRPMP